VRDFCSPLILNCDLEHVGWNGNQGASLDFYAAGVKISDGLRAVMAEETEKLLCISPNYY
jgi:hypothetical protein